VSIWEPGTWPDDPRFPDYPSEGWLLDEDRALRDLMKGMVVSDHENHTRHVEAWFGHPDQELREQKYPYVTVDLLQIEEGKERVHRGHYYFDRPPAPWWNLPPLTGNKEIYRSEMPTPVNLYYQVSTWARNPRHDRQILFQMITGGRSRIRGNLLWCADKTDRRLDYLGHVKRDTVEGGKRLFNNVFRLMVSSQVPYGVIGDPNSVDILGMVEAVHLDFYGYAARTKALLGEQVVITYGEIAAYDRLERRADVLLRDTSQLVTDVPVSRDIYTLGTGEIVTVLQQPKVATPTQPSDYRFLVLAIEALPVVTPVTQENGVTA
jgi:hypothetical protein